MLHTTQAPVRTRLAALCCSLAGLRLLLTCLVLTGFGPAHAQRSTAISARSVAQRAATGVPAAAQSAQPALQLDATHLLLDGSLSDAEVRTRPYVYNDFREAARHFRDTVTLYIAPYVYWVDNPDTPAVVTGRDGREPFGIVIRAKNVRFIGLSERAEDVVLASQRGQTQGAVGNFTMFDFHVDSLSVENLTMGNYCNVDLVYPMRPGLSRPKRSEAITQAHVGYVRGRSLTARNVRFISRLNLNPLNGADHSRYEDCHFECTDDALNGNATYLRCRFELYGQKPFYTTHGRGALFRDCDFYVRSGNRDMYFCKQGGPVTLVDCRYHAPAGTYLGWAPYPQRWLRCYQQNFTLNGEPYLIGQQQNVRPGATGNAAEPQSENTVLTAGFQGDEAPHLALSAREATLLTGHDSLLLSVAATHWRVQEGFEHLIRLLPATATAGTDHAGDASWVVVPTNETDETAVFCIEATTDDGRVGACQVTVKPRPLPPPAFRRKPQISIGGGMAHVTYALDLQGRRDESAITWLRDGIPVAVSHDSPARDYRLSAADIGHRLSVEVAPKSQRSTWGEVRKTTMKSAISAKSVSNGNTLETDFHDFPCQWQPEQRRGYWVVDGFKPSDTAEFPWSFSRERPMWTYGEGFNGAVGKGLLQAQRGARLMYTPAVAAGTDQHLTLTVDPTKTAGQGFGSATGQYMDVCVRFDCHTLTGYALRIIRTVKHAKAVDFLLVRYDHGQTTPITAPVTATCYRTGCHISLSAVGNQLTAHVETATPKPQDSSLPHVVDLSATIGSAPGNGIAIQHTGSCGESTTMLHHLKVVWQ